LNGGLEVPYSSKNVLQTPVLFSILALFVYVFALLILKNRGKLPAWRFGAFLLSAAAVWTAFGWLSKLLNPDPVARQIYARAVSGRVLTASHYIGVAGAVLTFLLLLVLEMRARKAAVVRAEEEAEWSGSAPTRRKGRRRRSDEDDDF
jgi:hypothetical protein